MKVYGFFNSTDPYPRCGMGPAVAINEEGSVVGSWVCTNQDFAKTDLLRCNGADSWDYEFVPVADVPTHEGLQKALEANRALTPQGEQ